MALKAWGLWLAWLAVVLRAVPAAAQDGWPEDLLPPCDAEKLESWGRLRREIEPLFAHARGRLPFALMSQDIQVLTWIRDELLGELNVHDAMLVTVAVPRPESFSECLVGVLTLRALFILMQVSVSPAEAVGAAAALSHIVLGLPWEKVLLTGWPLYPGMATLAKWVSPHTLDARIAQHSGQHARAAYKAATEMFPESQCDRGETGATLVARRLLSATWRDRDPTATAAPPPGAVAAEAVLAGVGGPCQAWGGYAGGCCWTEHRGLYLGGPLETSPEAGDLMSALAACDREAACAGVTMEPDPDAPRSATPFARQGAPFLEPSPSGELSYVRWCDTACPFARVTSLLVVATRRLQGGDLEDLPAELVAEAWAELAGWASGVEQQTTQPELIGAELWGTEWPIWDALGQLQDRVSLLRSPAGAGSGGGAAQPAWARKLQRTLGFDDLAWRLATEDLAETAGADGAGVPKELRERVRCSSGPECSGELFARMQLLLYQHKRLPLRDAIFITTMDHINPLQLTKNSEAKDFDFDYDWGQMLRDAMEQQRLGIARDLEAERDRLMPAEHPLQVDRRQLANFVVEVRGTIAASLKEGETFFRCLEWDQPFLLVRAFQGMCNYLDVFSYSEPTPEEPLMGLPGFDEYPRGTRHYWGDLEHPAGIGIEDETFGLILAPFVFEHVSQPFKAMETLVKTLRPGGYLIWAAPMFQQYHGSPKDFFRYTPKGARSLAQHSGLEVVRMYAPGDLNLASGVLMGMMLPYWRSEQYLSEREPEEGEDSPRHPLNIFVLMRKPPAPSPEQGSG